MIRRTAAVRSPDPAIASVAALMGDPARAAMLCALFGGGERTAGELAYLAGVAPNAATAHLSKLRAGGLVAMRADGRRRLFRLADADVARALEALAVIAPPAKIAGLSQSRIAADLRHARRCYDHLAGRLGVAVTERLVERSLLAPLRDEAYRPTAGGEAFFEEVGIDLAAARSARRHFAAQCVDWSERRPHLAGALGAALCKTFIDRHWVVRRSDTRALSISESGERWLRTALGITL